VAWWKSSYDKKQIKFRDRYLFADLKLPAGVETVKSVNWDATSGTLAAGGSKPAATTKPAGKAAKGTAKGEAEN
jgi:hypothetical protein